MSTAAALTVKTLHGFGQPTAHWQWRCDSKHHYYYYWYDEASNTVTMTTQVGTGTTSDYYDNYDVTWTVTVTLRPWPG